MTCRRRCCWPGRTFALAFALALPFAAVACGTTTNDDLTDGVLDLPPALREVSAIALAADGRVACLQDELGVIHLIDPTGKVPPAVCVFGERGDYEGLARVGDDWWALRSDGRALRIVHRDGAWRVAGSVRLPAEHAEWEALCHDAAEQRLLAMPKGVSGDDKDERDLRPIYAIDPVALTVTARPVLQLSRRALIAQAEERRIELPTRSTNKGKVRVDLGLVISELAVAPGGDLLLLCPRDALVLRVDRTGAPKGARRLDPVRLPQAEGMTFLADGRLLVASEGVDGPGRLVVVELP